MWGFFCFVLFLFFLLGGFLAVYSCFVLFCVRLGVCFCWIFVLDFLFLVGGFGFLFCFLLLFLGVEFRLNTIKT